MPRVRLIWAMVMTPRWLMLGYMVVKLTALSGCLRPMTWPHSWRATAQKSNMLGDTAGLLLLPMYHGAFALKVRVRSEGVQKARAPSLVSLPWGFPGQVPSGMMSGQSGNGRDPPPP